MSGHLFVYGTLLPELAPPAMREVVGQLQPVAGGAVRGRLYDLGLYPGAVTDEGAETLIAGRVYALPEPDAVLAALDEYEGFDMRSPGTSLFVRRLCPVRLTDGRNLTSWIYVYNRPLSAQPLIAGGDYLRHRAGVAAAQ